MANRLFKPVRGKRIRVTRLDNCGRLPAAGEADSFIVTEGFISAQLSSVTEDGPEITQRGITGKIVINDKLPNDFKRFTVQLGFIGVNPALIPMVSNAEGYFDAAGDNAGFTIAEGAIEKWFAFEIWSGISGAACEPGEENASGYMVLPFVVGGTLGDITIDGENAVNFTMTGAYTQGGNQWGVGPYQVAYNDDATPVADFLPEPLGVKDHFLILRTGIAPPPVAEDPQPMVGAGTSTTTTTTTAAP